MKKRHLIILVISLFAIGFGCKPKQEVKSEKGSEHSEYYTEKYRPQFHFSPEANWMNDPNGMFYYEGEYHLFYQYYPDSTVWGPMHWGHAISPDMVHWEHMPIALFPDEHGYIFSGSAVVDWKNTSSLGKDGQPPLIAIFTYHDMEAQKAGEIDFETQGIAFSNDKGRTWTKYGEPVLKNPGIKDFRDPKVSWHEDSQKWIMTLAVQDHIEFYSSPNLIEWEKDSEFGKELGAHGGVWECPDLFQMNVEGSDEKQWVLLVSINPGGPNGGSATQYFIGDFDGSTFTTTQTETKWIDSGRDNYAGVTWSDIPNEDGRRLFLGWMSNWNYANVVPTEKWRSAMTLPRTLSLIKKEDQYVLKSSPVKETELITDNSTSVNIDEALKISEVKELDIQGLTLNQSRLSMEFEMGETLPESFGILLENELDENITLSYSASAQQFQFDRTQSGDMSFSDHFSGISVAPYKIGSTLNLEIFVDAASVEIFVDGGDLVMTEIFFNSQPFSKLKVFAEGQPLTLTSAKFSNINSIW
jgi:fructan beta-fructosidase